MMVAVFAALCAAVFFAASSALQHRSTADTADLPSFRIAQVGAFVARTLRHPAWIAGLVADTGALALHALALNKGPLTLVQPLLVTGMVFALPFRHWLDHQRLKASEVVWSMALVAGLVLFLGVAAPAHSSLAAADRFPGLVVGGLVAIGVVVSAMLGRRSQGTRAALLLGVATGLTFAVTAALIKAVTDVAARNPGALLTTWTVYALVAVGAAGLLLNQLAFQAGPLRASLPAISTIDPIVSLVIGVSVYDEHLRGGAMALSAELVGLILVVAATVALARSGADGDGLSERPAATGTRQGPKVSPRV